MPSVLVSGIQRTNLACVSPSMHALTSVLFLPPILQAVSPHLRPYLLHSHFRVMIAYWVSRGRPDLYIQETLMAATAAPRARSSDKPTAQSAIARALERLDVNSKGKQAASDVPESPKTPRANRTLDLASESGEDDQEDNAWPRLLASAADHPDDHVAKASYKVSRGAVRLC